jgi:hypothetical protein
MLDSLANWVAHPFNEQMDLLHWVLFIVVIMAVIYLWNDVLKLAE